MHRYIAICYDCACTVLITPLCPTFTGELNDLDFWLAGPDKPSGAKPDTPKQQQPPPAAAEDTAEEAGKKIRKKGEKVLVLICMTKLIHLHVYAAIYFCVFDLSEPCVYVYKSTDV